MIFSKRVPLSILDVHPPKRDTFTHGITAEWQADNVFLHRQLARVCRLQDGTKRQSKILISCLTDGKGLDFHSASL